MALHSPYPPARPWLPLQSKAELELEELHSKHLFKARKLPAFYRRTKSGSAQQVRGAPLVVGLEKQ